MSRADESEPDDLQPDDLSDSHGAYLQTREAEYSSDLEDGKIERSNFEANKAFLESSGLLNGALQILEVGCGAGTMTAYLADRGFTTIGTDVSEVLLRYARKAHPECRFEHMRGEVLRFPDDRFDLVVSFDVLEHIPDVEAHVREVRRVLRPGGHYLLQTPNKWTNLPFSIVRDRSLARWKKYHPSLQTKKSLTRMLEGHGFSVQIVRMPVANEFFKEKLIFPLNLVDIDKLPIQTNIYAIARLAEA